MSYDGYLIKIGGMWDYGGLKLPIVDGANVIKNGTYLVRTEEKIVREWDDLLGYHHIETFGDKIIVEFTIKERTEAQNQLLRDLFNPLPGTRVTYYDPKTQQYYSKEFKFEFPENIVTIATDKGVYYAETSVILTEV